MLYSKILQFIVFVVSWMGIVFLGDSVTVMAQQSSFNDRYPDIISWNSDGSRIAVATKDGEDSEEDYQNQQIQMIDAFSGQILFSIPVGNFNILYLSWENNTELLSVNSVGKIQRFNAQNGSLIAEWNTITGLVSNGIDVNPSGAWIALVIESITPNTVIPSGEKVLQIHDAINGNVSQSFVLPLPASANVNWLGWSPDGTRIAITSSRGSLLVYSWNGVSLSFQREILIASDRTGITYGAWGPDSRQLAVATKRSSILPGIIIYNTDNGTQLRQMDQSTNTSRLIWSPETNLIAAVIGLNARVWDGTTGQIIQNFTYSAFPISLAWSPNGTLAAGKKITADELSQNPNLTGVVAQRPSSLPTLTPTPTNTFTPTLTATNTPTHTPTSTPTSTPGSSTLTLNPVADAYVDATNPTTNFGSLTTLRTDGSPIQRSYLRFQVPTLSGSVVSATLRVFANSAVTVGYTVHSTSGGWVETTINYNNAPTFGSSLGTSGAIVANTWTSVNITSLVTGAGQYNLVMATTNNTATSFSSREGANPPQLVIVTG